MTVRLFSWGKKMDFQVSSLRRVCADGFGLNVNMPQKWQMHLPGTSVLTLIILLPLAFPCDYNSNRITEDYRNIIWIKLEHVVNGITQLNSNCTSRNVGVRARWQATNAQQTIKKICRVNSKLEIFGSESRILNGELKVIFNALVKEMNESLGCRCYQKKQQKKSPQNPGKWKLCKVKDILYSVQNYYELHNTFQSMGNLRSKPEYSTWTPPTLQHSQDSGFDWGKPMLLQWLTLNLVSSRMFHISQLNKTLLGLREGLLFVPQRCCKWNGVQLHAAVTNQNLFQSL